MPLHLLPRLKYSALVALKVVHAQSVAQGIACNLPIPAIGSKLFLLVQEFTEINLWYNLCQHQLEFLDRRRSSDTGK
jgi:hypothetical protein